MRVKIGSEKRYDIEIEKIKKLPNGFIITDKNLAREYEELLENRDKYIINPGEKNKNLETYKEVLEALKEKKVEKIISFGGGVIGDLAGFVASTYKRGIDLIHVPTSLIGMVDSSIGGKTGINLDNKKNYVGTFYQPEKVLIDTSFLTTLPEEEFRNGIAEIVKYSIIFDKPSLNELERVEKDKNMSEIIKKCCEAKKRVVEKDVNDKGYRHTLNFGHTIGHAIELLSGLRHGEAVSIGMVKEIKLGKKLGYFKDKEPKKVKSVLEKNKLPTELPNINIDKALELMEYDKKGPLTFVFSENDYNIKVEKNKIKEVLKNG